MWESITRGKETKGTIIMLHVDRNSEQDNRMMWNGDKGKTEKHRSINWRGTGEDAEWKTEQSPEWTWRKYRRRLWIEDCDNSVQFAGRHFDAFGSYNISKVVDFRAIELTF
jgi:hypothetical protein